MKFSLNKNLNKEELKNQFREDKAVAINNFLDNDCAEALHKFLNEEMPEDWWHASFYYGKEGGGYDDGVQNIRRFEGNLPIIENKLKETNEFFLSGFFCYNFDRTVDNHYDECPCLECSYRVFLKSDELLNFIKEITGAEVNTPQEFFSSRFTANQFLSPHHDINKGKIASVLSLSKDWKPEYGGNLHFMTEDYKKVTRIVQPEFNRLVLFDIPSRNGIPHFVSHVAPSVKNKRISITGWFN